MWWILGLVLVIVLAGLLTRVSISAAPAAVAKGGCNSCPKKQNNPTVW